jgi:hypothetical protein
MLLTPCWSSYRRLKSNISERSCLWVKPKGTTFWVNLREPKCLVKKRDWRGSGMAILRVKHSRNYTCIANQAIRDKRLSFRARGLHHLLLSYPDNWVINTQQLNQESDKEGRDAIATALKELEKLGYITRSRVKDPTTGQFSWESVISELPINGFSGDGLNPQDYLFESGLGCESINGSPVNGSPVNGSPVNGKPGHILSTDLRSNFLTSTVLKERESYATRQDTRDQENGYSVSEPGEQKQATNGVGAADQTPKTLTKKSGDRAKGSAAKTRSKKSVPKNHSEEFEAWWNSYYTFCVDTQNSAGKRYEAVAVWDELAELQIPLADILAGSDYYIRAKRRQYEVKGEAIGVPHGVRFLRNDKWKEALDYVRRQQQGRAIEQPSLHFCEWSEFESVDLETHQQSINTIRAMWQALGLTWRDPRWLDWLKKAQLLRFFEFGESSGFHHLPQWAVRKLAHDLERSH